MGGERESKRCKLWKNGGEKKNLVINQRVSSSICHQIPPLTTVPTNKTTTVSLSGLVVS